MNSTSNIEDVVTLHVKRGTANWLEWKNLGDHQRGKFRAIAARRFIELWERVRGLKKWTPISFLAPFHKGAALRRWTRRNLYTLQNAGLIEVKMIDGATHFRRKR